jgi:hypothetical protein
MAFVAVTLLPPAFSLCPHAPPGKKAWWNAKAGAAIMVSIRSDTNATAKNIITLLKRDHLPSLVYYGGTYAAEPPLDYFAKPTCENTPSRTRVNKDGFSSVGQTRAGVRQAPQHSGP